MKEFLQHVRPKGFLCLVAIHPLGAGIWAKTFEMPSEIAQAERWAFDQNVSNNVYWTVNPVKSRVNKKPSKADIQCVEWLHVDIDPDPALEYSIAQDKLMYEQLLPLMETGATVLHTGNGLAAFFRLSEPISIEEGEQLNKQLICQYDGDLGTHNADRIMRLPCTYNYPTKTKLAKGYPREPRLATVQSMPDRVHNADSLALKLKPVASDVKADSVVEFREDTTPLSSEEERDTWGRLEALLRTDSALEKRWSGSDHGLNDTSGSGKDMSVMALLKKHNFVFRESAWLIMKFEHGSETKDDRQIRRMWEKSFSKPTIEKINFDAIMSQLLDMISSLQEGEKLSAKHMDQFIPTLSEASLSVAEEAEIYELIKKHSLLSSNKAIDKAIRQRNGSDHTTHLAIANAVINLIGHENAIFVNNRCWLWENKKPGLWSMVDDRVIQKKIHLVHEEMLDDDFSKSTIVSILDIIKTELYKDEHVFNTNNRIINVKNGELHHTQGHWILQPHERTHYSTIQLPITFNPCATAPRFAKFLAEIFDGDPDGGAKTQVLLEMMGYTLLSTSQFEKFAILVGNGANGKSVVLGIVEALCGGENVCAVQPDKFDSTFQRAHLSSKLANIITEISIGAKIPDAQLKAIVSGELTTAEHKNKDPFDFHPVCTCWFGTNHMPHIRDLSDAIFRRVIILSFNNSFEGDQCDPRLLETLISELPGILNLVLEAVSCAIERRCITTCDSSEKAIKAWRHDADQAARFIGECCVTSSSGSCKIEVLYTSYKAWAAREGIKGVLGSREFGNRLTQLGFPPDRGSGGVRLRKGIGLKGNTATVGVFPFQKYGDASDA